MKVAGAGLSLNFHRPGPVTAILRTIIRRQHLEFGDRIKAGIDV